MEEYSGGRPLKKKKTPAQSPPRSRSPPTSLAGSDFGASPAFAAAAWKPWNEDDELTHMEKVVQLLTKALKRNRYDNDTFSHCRR